MEMSTTHFWRSSQYPIMEVDGHCYFYESHQHVIIHGKMYLSVYVRILPSYIYILCLYLSIYLVIVTMLQVTSLHGNRQHSREKYDEISQFVNVAYIDFDFRNN